MVTYGTEVFRIKTLEFRPYSDGKRRDKSA